MSASAPYIRVGDDYFRTVYRLDKHGIMHRELKPIKRQTILDDHGREYLRGIPQYDTFINLPSHNGQYADKITPTMYNLYQPFIHKPMMGEWLWTERLIRHVFGDQYELGMDYIQLLYQQPAVVLPILCLVSRENATGKTTFINWLSRFFYGNVAVVGNQDIHNQFNSHYITKLIIAVDESRIDKASSLEKIKAMATQDKAFVNGKYQQPFSMDYFGKIILLSNYEDNFINARDEDIRYWVRKLGMPEHINYDIDQALQDEIPAFVHYLNRREMVTTKRSRMWFDPDDIETEALDRIRMNSRSWLHKELLLLFEDFFNHHPEHDFVDVSLTDIRDRWFSHNNQVQINYIKKVLQDEIKIQPQGMTRYMAFGQGENKPGTPYRINREFITVNQKIEDEKAPF